jgi:Cytochrome oxidase complex assembly protein 1
MLRIWRGAILVLAIVILLAVLHHYGSNRRLARLATETAQISGLIDQEIGTPISPGMLVHGHIVEGTNGGNADLEIPVRGSHGSGTLFAWEQRDRGPWRVCSLSFRSNRGMEIVIVADEASRCARGS